MRTLSILLILTVMVVASGCKTTPTTAATTQPETQEQAVAVFKKWGGKIERDAFTPNRPIVGLDLSGTKVTDVGLEHLKGLDQLQTLNLSKTKVTDAGLEQLKGLNQLRTLNLINTKVTDEGVKYLQEGLPKCSIGY